MLLSFEGKTYRTLASKRDKLTLITRLLSKTATRWAKLEGLGTRATRSAIWLTDHQHHHLSHTILSLIRSGLCIAIWAHIALRRHDEALYTARLLNAMFRHDICAQNTFASHSYYNALSYTRSFHILGRDFKTKKDLVDHGITSVVCNALIYVEKTEIARVFLDAYVQNVHKDAFAYRLLGRVNLIEKKYSSAISEFDKSALLAPNTIMSHQNYAGRYDISNYKPINWEVTNAGKLLVYDNLMQMAEEFILLGKVEKAYELYNEAALYQKTLQSEFKEIVNCHKICYGNNKHIEDSCGIRILSYEWVTQFGHLGLLDIYVRMSILGYIPQTVYILLAPGDKIANKEYLDYWHDYFCIVQNESLIAELFPLQRFFGDQFMALLTGGHEAEPWTRAGARAQVEWARQRKPPLLRLRDEHRTEGREILYTEFGVPKDAWYVGLHVREGDFHSDGMGTISEHRSANIADYSGAITEITSRGGWVIRLGDSSMARLSSMPNAVDYALSRVKSESMDLFLLASSRFIIGTTSGLSTVAMSFGTPVMLANCISNDWQLWADNVDFILKKVYNLRERRYLTLREIYSLPVQGYLMNNVVLRRHGYSIHSNTPFEIEESVRYKLNKLEGRLTDVDDDHPLMRRYRQSISHNPLIFGAAKPALPFLEQNDYLLDT